MSDNSQCDHEAHRQTGTATYVLCPDCGAYIVPSAPRMVPPEAVPDLMRERLGCPRCAVLVEALRTAMRLAVHSGVCASRKGSAPPCDCGFDKANAALAVHEPVGMVFPKPPEMPQMFRKILRGLVPLEILEPVQSPCPRCCGTGQVLTREYDSCDPAPGTSEYEDCPDCADWKKE